MPLFCMSDALSFFIFSSLVIQSTLCFADTGLNLSCSPCFPNSAGTLPSAMRVTIALISLSKVSPRRTRRSISLADSFSSGLWAIASLTEARNSRVRATSSRSQWTSLGASDQAFVRAQSPVLTFAAIPMLVATALNTSIWGKLAERKGCKTRDLRLEALLEGEAHDVTRLCLSQGFYFLSWGQSESAKKPW